MNKILIVDDEKDIHLILKKHLERIGGIEVIDAYSGEEGVAIYKKLFENDDKPSLVIMDLNLAGEENMEQLDKHIEGKDKKMDGVRATREILKIDPSAVIWGYTAWFGTEWAKRLKETGAKRVVERILPFKKFVEMVKDFLSNKT